MFKTRNHSETKPSPAKAAAALILTSLLAFMLTAVPAAAGPATSPDDTGAGVLARLGLWVDAGLHRLAAGLGGFGGTGDDGMGIDPDGGGGDDDGTSSDPPPPGDGSGDGTTDDDTTEGSSTGA